MNAEAMALSHKMRLAEAVKSPPVSPTASSASCEITPVSTKPETRTNKPMKKKMVGHSTLDSTSSRTCSPVKRRSIKAPAKATVADSK
ncbi:hypothetical protein D3C76_1633450 [compost metagenome]